MIDCLFGSIIFLPFFSNYCGIVSNPHIGFCLSYCSVFKEPIARKRLHYVTLQIFFCQVTFSVKQKFFLCLFALLATYPILSYPYFLRQLYFYPLSLLFFSLSPFFLYLTSLFFIPVFSSFFIFHHISYIF